jgi:hypothetical protein
VRHFFIFFNILIIPSVMCNSTAKKSERAEALKTVKKLCKEFGFTAGMLRGSLKK